MFLTRSTLTLAASLLLIATLLLAALGSAPAAAQTAGTPTLVQVIDTSIWPKPSPDPSGITYWPAHDTLVIADGEVDEMPIFAGANIFESTRTGAYVAGYDVSNFNNETVGIDIDVAPNGHFFISNDSAKLVFDISLGPDGQFDTGDDVIRSFSTLSFGNTDPEGLTLGAGKLYTLEGANQEIYVSDPGPNGIFDGAGDDSVTHFDVAAIGIGDPEGVDYHPATGTLYVADRRNRRVSEITTSGALIRVIDLRPWGAINPGDVTLAPSTATPGALSLYVADRGIDNNDDPNENDGKVYEISLGDAGGGDTTPPTATNRAPAPDAAGVSLAANVTATFSEDAGGVNDSSFKLEGPGGALVPAVVTYDASTRTATLNPSADLAPNTTYTASLTGAIKDAANNALSPLAWSFTTLDLSQDTTPPAVTDRAPAPDAANVAITANIMAIFSEDVAGVGASSFMLTQPGGGAVAASVAYDPAGRTATLDPTVDLATSTTYTVQLSGAIADLAGNPLAPVSWTFTTAASPPPPSNLVSNPGFEIDANGDGKPDVWSTNNKFARLCSPNVPAPGPHGESCAGRFSATDNSGAKSTQVIDNVVAGTTYSFSAWVNIPATSDSFSFKPQIKWLDSANNSISTKTVKTYSAATSGWDQATFSGAAPAGTVRAEIRLNATSLNGMIYVDDVSFTSGSGSGGTTTPADTVAPSIAGQTPAGGASGVAAGTSVTATFSEDVTGVSGATFTLTPQSGGASVGAAVSYDATARKATLVPAGPLSDGTTYTAQLSGGITDLAGNALAATNWSFTTAASEPPPGGTTFTFAPVADTYVSQPSPTGSFATAKELQSVGGSSAKIAYIRFDVSGLPAGVTVQSAKLRLTVTNDSTAGGTISAITNNAWAENINWNTRPAIDGPQLASLGAVATNTTVEIDLAAAIAGNGTYSFAIALPSTNTNTVGYASKENTTATKRPQLVIGVQ